MDENLCILRYYKRHIIKLKYMLNALDPSSNDLSPLADIQHYIIDRILDTEKKLDHTKRAIGELKGALRAKHSSKQRSKEIKAQMTKCSDSLSAYSYLLYVWRCFGDGIAFKYISKWNLKRLLFESDSPAIKASPGFLGDKSGIERELALMLDAISHGVPAVLCDITNTIRHGDICLLGESDPYVIEVKSSRNTNKRVTRQLESIQKIHNYLESDTGSVGGVPQMERVALASIDRHHNSCINEVILYAMGGGWSRKSPENGLHYIAINCSTALDYEEVFYGIAQPMLFLLNQAKTEKRWDNYYPFTLSLKTPEVLYAFLKGDVYVIVVIDGVVLKSLARDIGYDLSVVMADNIGFEMKKLSSCKPESIPYIISEHFVGRIGLEFLSLEWFVENEEAMMSEFERRITATGENA